MIRLLLPLLCCLAAGARAPGADVWLSDLDLSAVRQGWGAARKDRSVVEQPLKIAGRRFDKGVGTHANSEISLDVHQKALRLTASVGLDDDSRDPRGVDVPSVRFGVIGDGRLLWQSPVMILGREARRLDLDVTGVRHLSLLVVMANDKDNWEHADWADAKLVMADGTVPLLLDEPPRANDEAVAGFFKGAKKGRPAARKP